MIITPVKIDLDLTSHALVRSPGLHMSEIYNDLYNDPDKEGWEPEPLNLAAELGFSLEHLLESSLRDRRFYDRAGEFKTKEGIAFSPDALIFEGNRIRLGEFKVKWMSSRDVPRERARSFPPKFDKIITQMQSYAYNLDTPDGRLFVFFVNGNYKPPKPELLAWDITFSAKELKTNWDMMMNHARHRKML